MKKFWEKHDLLKVSGVMVLLTILLTWIFKESYWDGSQLVVGEMSPVGMFDVFTYGLLGMFYFTVVVTFVFVLGGFYQLLSKTTGYQNLTNSIAKAFDKKEVLFVLVTSFVIAALTSLLTEYYVVIGLIPFVITIMSKMKMHKITTFTTTFGSMLVGFVGSVYSTKISSMTNSVFLLNAKDNLWLKIALFLTTFVIFNLFTLLFMKKNNKVKKADQAEELFEETATTKGKTWPAAVILGLFLVVTLLAYIPWLEVFNIALFKNITTSIKEVTILNSPVFGYLLGDVEPFGNWDLFAFQVLMIMTSIVMAFAYKIKLNDFLTSFGEGFKKVGKLVVVLLASYLILEFAVMFPVLPVVVDWIVNLTSSFNALLGTLSGFVVSLFTTEYQYTTNLIGPYLVGTFDTLAKPISLMMQTTYGLASFITPASAILLVGLSYLNISYKEWFKYIWKFLVALLVLIVGMMFLLVNVL